MISVPFFVRVSQRVGANEKCERAWKEQSLKGAETFFFGFWVLWFAPHHHTSAYVLCHARRLLFSRLQPSCGATCYVCIE